MFCAGAAPAKSRGLSQHQHCVTAQQEVERSLHHHHHLPGIACTVVHTHSQLGPLAGERRKSFNLDKTAVWGMHRCTCALRSPSLAVENKKTTLQWGAGSSLCSSAVCGMHCCTAQLHSCLDLGGQEARAQPACPRRQAWCEGLETKPCSLLAVNAGTHTANRQPVANKDKHTASMAGAMDAPSTEVSIALGTRGAKYLASCLGYNTQCSSFHTAACKGWL